jgi:hypothetical protein
MGEAADRLRTPLSLIRVRTIAVAPLAGLSRSCPDGHSEHFPQDDETARGPGRATPGPLASLTAPWVFSFNARVSDHGGVLILDVIAFGILFVKVAVGVAAVADAVQIRN